MNTNQRVDLAVQKAVEVIRVLEIIPHDTDNLRKVAFSMERMSKNKWRVFINDEKAPYAVYVNEPWISPKWNGKDNPNEGFWDEVVEKLAEIIKNKINGKE